MIRKNIRAKTAEREQNLKQKFGCSLPKISVKERCPETLESITRPIIIILRNLAKK